LKLNLEPLLPRLKHERLNLKQQQQNLEPLLPRLKHERLNLEQQQQNLEPLLPRLKQQKLNLENEKLNLEPLLPRLKHKRLNLKHERLNLEPMSCLLEKQHRFNSKMHSIEHHRVRLEQHMPRRHLPESKLTIMPSSSSSMLVRLEQEMLIVE